MRKPKNKQEGADGGAWYVGWVDKRFPFSTTSMCLVGFSRNMTLCGDTSNHHLYHLWCVSTLYVPLTLYSSPSFYQ